MRFAIEVTDWYHCNIYRRRLFSGLELVGKARMDLNGDVHLYVDPDNKKILSYQDDIKADAKLYMLKSRVKG